MPVIALLKLGRGVTFFIYAALLKYNRIGEVEMMFCGRHFGKPHVARRYREICSKDFLLESALRAPNHALRPKHKLGCFLPRWRRPPI